MNVRFKLHSIELMAILSIYQFFSSFHIYQLIALSWRYSLTLVSSKYKNKPLSLLKRIPIDLEKSGSIDHHLDQILFLSICSSSVVKVRRMPMFHLYLIYIVITEFQPFLIPFKENEIGK